jgi:hypothetical protein
MGKPTNVEKGKQGFQRTSRTPPVPSMPVTAIGSPASPTADEVARRALEVQALYAGFQQAAAPPRPVAYDSLVGLVAPDEGVSGILAVTVPARGAPSISEIKAHVEADLTARERERFRRAWTQSGEVKDDDIANLTDATPDESVEQWRRLYGCVLRGQVLTSVINEDGSHTHTMAFIDVRWPATAEAFLRSSGSQGCLLTGEVCEPETIYEVHADPGRGAIYQPMDENDEPVPDDM